MGAEHSKYSQSYGGGETFLLDLLHFIILIFPFVLLILFFILLHYTYIYTLPHCLLPHPPPICRVRQNKLLSSSNPSHLMKAELFSSLLKQLK